MKTKASTISPVHVLFLALLSALIIGFVPLSVQAEGPVIRSGETVGVEANQLLEGDFYGLGQTITLSGEATRDVYAIGGAVTTNAPVNEDLVVAGGVVQVHGEVKDDIRIIGGEVVIASPVADDVVVIGGSVQILSTASIAGDLIFFGSEVRIDGPVEGTVYGTANKLRIDARVGKDVSVRVGETFTLGDSAQIEGNISYKSAGELVRGQGAVVSGTISRDAFVDPSRTQDFEPIIFNILILLFSSLTIFFLARSRTETLVRTMWEGYGRLGLIGLGMFIALPVVAVILMASVIGLVVGVSILLSYMLLGAVAFMCLPIVAGALIQKNARLGDHMSVFTVLLGVCAVILIPFIPAVGGFLLFVGFIMVFGTLCHEIYRFFKGI